MATTIYTPQNPSPRNEVRDMSINQDFTVVIDGVKCTDYQIIIYKVSDNAVVLDTTKLTLGSPLADGEILTHTVIGGSIPNTGTDSYKWTIEVWNDAESVLSREFQFFAKTTPVLTFVVPPTITTQSYEFTATIAQAEGDIVNNYTFELYDSTGELLEDSGLITSFNIAYTFDGFIDGTSFKIRLFGTTTGGQTFDSGLVDFDVSYTQPDLDLEVTAVFDPNTSFITTSRAGIVQIIGESNNEGSLTYPVLWNTASGADPEIKAVSIPDASTYVSFDVDIPLESYGKFQFRADNSFEGKMLQYDDGSYEIGRVSGRFYYTINGITQYTIPVDITDKIVYFIVLPTEVQFKITDDPN